VIDYFVSEYLIGRTPNPCIACNRAFRFQSLLQKARELEIDYVATGHYARIVYDEKRKRYLLLKGKDGNKDQSYFLYGFRQSELQQTLLPLGDYVKPQIRQIARDLGLPVAEKAESQEICFIPDNDYRRFIQERSGLTLKPGPFLDREGNVLGQHQGIAYYTVGQRKGLGLALGYPVYVIDIDPGRNAVIIGDMSQLKAAGLISIDNNFLPFDELTSPFLGQVKIRYRAAEVPALINPVSGGVRVEFIKPQKAVTPGQTVVFYDNDLVIGGGTIDQRILPQKEID
ncbi:MAG TPA: tRNA 2-thiouridine(34) synthase MnmA, partial [Clostridia bacterium]|nr:tRNA 2-thiouridine(34) synthase MnmA [Clostridia bacterium]